MAGGKLKTFKQFSCRKKPQKVHVRLEDLRYKLEGDLDKAIALLQELKGKHKGVENLSLSIEVEDDYGDSHYVSVELMGYRLETEQEFEERLQKEYAWYKDLEERKRKQYEELKKEFEGR